MVTGFVVLRPINKPREITAMKKALIMFIRNLRVVVEIKYHPDKITVRVRN